MCPIAFAETAVDSENVAATITYLLTYVENSDCIFIRNEKNYTAKEAVRHMQRKYGYFKNEIKTPEDFIRLAASQSLVSGKPYMVKTKAGQLMKSETWLLETLEAYRQRRHEQAVDNSQ